MFFYFPDFESSFEFVYVDTTTVFSGSRFSWVGAIFQPTHPHLGVQALGDPLKMGCAERWTRLWQPTIKQLWKGKRIAISSNGALSEAVCISALFHIWFLFHTVAIASLGFLRSESFRVWVFCNKKGIDNAQLARVGLDWEGFGWTLSYVSSTGR